jgi:hypothetical protein
MLSCATGNALRRCLRRVVAHRAPTVLTLVTLLTPVLIAVVGQPASAATQGNISTVAGTRTPGYNTAGLPGILTELDSPASVALDARGNVLIADSGNNMVRVLAVSATNPGYPLGGCSGGCIWARPEVYNLAGTTTRGYSGDGGPATSAELDNPGGLALDSAGNVLIADLGNDLVRVVAVSASNPGYPLAGCSGSCTWTVGDIYTVAGHFGTVGYVGDGGSSTSAALDYPSAVAVDADGNVLIGDSNNGAVRVVAVGSNPGYLLAGCSGTCTWTQDDIYTIAGTGTAGYGGDGGPATSAQLSYPSAVSVDAQGNVLIADSNNERVRVLALSATNRGYPLAGCSGTCTWTVGDIYTVAGTGTAGYGGDGGSATSAKLSDPTGVAVDGWGLYIADNFNSRLRLVVVGVPSAPTHVAAVPEAAGTSTGSLKVTFRLPASSGGFPITRTTATCSSSNRGITKSATRVGPTAVPITVSGVTTGKTYQCRLTASNSQGTGTASGASLAVNVGAPAAPTRVIATPLSGAPSLRVTFTLGSGNGAPVGSKTATCASTNGGVKRANTGFYANNDPIVVRSLSAHKTYKCTVKAFNSRGASLASASSRPVVTN